MQRTVDFQSQSFLPRMASATFLILSCERTSVAHSTLSVPVDCLKAAKDHKTAPYGSAFSHLGYSCTSIDV